jgi:hypothetical protein
MMATHHFICKHNEQDAALQNHEVIKSDVVLTHDG